MLFEGLPARHRSFHWLPSLLSVVLGLVMGLGIPSYAVSATASDKPFVVLFLSRKQLPSDQAAEFKQFLAADLRRGDYVSFDFLAANPDFSLKSGEIPKLYTAADSLDALRAQAEAACAAGPAKSPQIIYYDGEHWDSTPPAEQADMPAAIATGKTYFSATGCPGFGVVPDAQYVGIPKGSCAYSAETAIHRKIDWHGIAAYNIQAQRLLNSRCLNLLGRDNAIANYVATVREIAREVKKASPTTQVTTQFSFRLTPPAVINAAIEQLRDDVDGFAIFYKFVDDANFSTPGNLHQVLVHIRQR